MYAFLVSLLFMVFAPRNYAQAEENCPSCWVRWDLRSASVGKRNMRVIEQNEDNPASHPPFPRLSLDLQARPVP